MTVRLAVAVSLLMIAAGAFAGLTATLDRKAAGVKETFYIIVRADGGRIGEPILPHTNGLVIQKQSVTTRQQTSVQFINGRVQQKNVREWQYQAWGTQPGPLEIPPVKVNIDGQDVLSEPVKIEIQDHPAGNPPVQTSQPDHEPDAEPGTAPQPAPGAKMTIDDTVLLEASVSKTTIYEGEALAYTVNYRRIDDPAIFVRGMEGNQIQLPAVDDFFEGDIDRKEMRETIKGLNYVTTTFSRAMYATKPGTVQIPAVMWQGRVTAPTNMGPRSFMVDRATEPITIEVKPLPPSVPRFSGAVGRYSINGDLEAGTVEQGKPKVYTITIAGEGNVDALPKPEFPSLDWCHVSEPDITVNPVLPPLQFEKKFAYTLTPMEAAAHEIPAVDFVYFAPDLGGYKTVSTKPVEVQVVAAKDEGKLVTVGGQATPKGGAVDILNADIAPIDSTAVGLGPARSGAPVNALGFGSPPLLFLACLAYIRRRRRLATDLGYARGVRAKSRSQKRLREAARSKDPGEALFKALTGFLGDKLNLPDEGMTSQDVRAAMEEKGFTPELVDEYVKVLRTCERQRYAGEAFTPAELSAVTAAAESALEHLEKVTGAVR